MIDIQWLPLEKRWDYMFLAKNKKFNDGFPRREGAGGTLNEVYDSLLEFTGAEE